MVDDGLLSSLKEEIEQLKERVIALEREQRLLIEDILSGEPQVRLQKRLLEKPRDIEELKRKIDEKIRIEI